MASDVSSSNSSPDPNFNPNQVELMSHSSDEGSITSQEDQVERAGQPGSLNLRDMGINAQNAIS